MKIVYVIGIAICGIIVGNLTFQKKKLEKYPILNSSKKYKAFIIGGSGATGKNIIKELINSPMCEKITSFQRSEEEIFKSDKLITKKIDFDNINEKEFEQYDFGISSFGTTFKKAGTLVTFIYNKGKLF